MDAHSGNSLRNLLLPPVFRIIGWVMASAGLIFSYLRFASGIKPTFLDTKVFAFYSSYFETKIFKVISNNISEEICGITLLAGLFFIAFSREKQEHEHYWRLRLKAFMATSYVSLAFLVASFIFIYGIAFFYALSLYIFFPLLMYILIFRYLILTDRRANRI